MWLISFTLRPIYPQGNSSRFPLDERMDGPHKRFGHDGEEKYTQPLLVLEPQIIQSLAQRYTTELHDSWKKNTTTKLR